MKTALCFSFIFAAALSIPASGIQFRVATYNASLNRNTQTQLGTDLATSSNAQARQVAQILQRVRPDVVLINEFDYDANNPTLALTRFHDNYLAVQQAAGLAPLNYPYRYVAPSNTGVPSGFDLDNNGSVTSTPGTTAASRQDYGDDSFGFGEFPGQYSFAVYSRFPINPDAKRTFQLFKWKDMPGAVLPSLTSGSTAGDWYSPTELNVVRLSSKNHVDLRIELKPGVTFHLLASHPTPPSFDGGEDRNGRRNHDEIRLWADYISNAAYLYDDAGVAGGLAADQRFVILGDLNADPLDGDSFQSAVNQLRNHPLVNSTANPSSPGGTQQAQLQGGRNNSHVGNPAYDTADFGDGSVGNLRVDHVLASKKGFTVVGSGVFWPLSTDPTFSLVSASDHRLVYLDLLVEPDVQGFHIDRSGSDAVLTWKTQPGISYKVQTSPDLSAWGDAPTIAVIADGANQTASARDPDAVGAGKKFYRVAASYGSQASPQLAPAAATSPKPRARPVRSR
ncbi:MAG TPA: endonuclease/exonuclease/phosphatase family protein [Chthoniobacteraceae bacterium]|nr:endonuclease/exonuclease/phosphatase family protein [Chthoniobacteraceae bacterium]